MRKEYCFSLSPGCSSKDEEVCYYDVYGSAGTSGGNGGHGGIGGFGGSEGEIILHFLNGNSKAVTSRVSGLTGSAGKGAKGGRAGLTGFNIRVHCLYTTVHGAFNIGRDRSTDLEFHENKEFPQNKAGSNGIEGFVTENRQSALPKAAMNPALILNKFKSFLRINLNDNLKEEPIMKFLMSLEENKSIL